MYRALISLFTQKIVSHGSDVNGAGMPYENNTYWSHELFETPPSEATYKVVNGSVILKESSDFIQEKIDELAQYRYNKMSEDIIFEGNPYTATRESSLIVNMAAMLGQSRRWKCADGIHRDLTAAQLQQLAVEINTRMQAYYDKEETIADIIRNSQDVQSVNIQELWELN
jgi:hypothetical protein